MDISSNQLKTMKSKQLRNIIREAILEVLDENVAVKVKGTTGKETVQSFSNITAANQLKSQNSNIKSVEQLEEEELDEANVGGVFELAPDTDAESFTGKKKRIIAAMQDSGEPMTKASVAIALGYTKLNKSGQTVAKQQPIDSEFNELVRDEAIISAGTQSAPRFSRPQAAPGEEGEEPEDTSSWGGDEFFIGNKDVLSRFSSKAEPTDDEYEMEPEAGEIEKVGPVKTRISDEDYQSFMKYSELRDRLNAIKGNLAKERRSTGAGEFMGNQSKEDRVKALEATKKGLEDRIATLVAGSKHLQDKVAKEQTGKAPKLPEIEPVESEDEEELTENYEYTKRQLQYRAGIIK
jgi:hypothetical protein